MHRTEFAALSPRFPHHIAGGTLARRWYYTPKSHRAYSVRQISPGDRRLLAEFALSLNGAAPDRDLASSRVLTEILFDRVLSAVDDSSAGFVALEAAGAGDRVIGVAACSGAQDACFSIAVAGSHRDEQVGRMLLGTLIRHAKRAGVRRLSGEMRWSNRPMQMLAHSMGFALEPVARDRSLRRLVLGLR